MHDAEALKPIRDVLEEVRTKLDYALKRLKSFDELRCMRWRCFDCDYIKHFTRPMPAEVAPPCPKCALRSRGCGRGRGRAAGNTLLAFSIRDCLKAAEFSISPEEGMKPTPGFFAFLCAASACAAGGLLLSPCDESGEGPEQRREAKIDREQPAADSVQIQPTTPAALFDKPEQKCLA